MSEENLNKVEQLEFPAELLNSWEDFKCLVSSKLLAEDLENLSDNSSTTACIPRYLFRGQGDERWNLISSFDRTFNSLPDEDRDNMHDALLQFFQDECIHYPQYEQDIADKDRCLALAQHYGLPTRLLDWTASPYVAAFHAFSSHLKIDRGKGVSGKENKVAIWILDRRFRSFWGGQKGVKVLEPKPINNERQKRQSGWFTYATMTQKTLEEYVSAINNQQKALRKIILPASDADRALKDLNLMRINARELNADLSGAAMNAFVRAVLT